MGKVYLARQTDLGRQVVVKVMHEHIAADPKFRDRFQRETLVMARFHLVSPVAILLGPVLAIPVAIALNGVRIFLTAFLMYFVDPKLGRGFMHESEGWAMFLIAFIFLAMIAWSVRAVEKRLSSRKVGFDA